MMVSTDRLISATEARRKFGKMLADLARNQDNYYVIMGSGKIAAFLVHPRLAMNFIQDFPDLKSLRKNWTRYKIEVADALDKLQRISPDKRPRFLRSAL